MLPVLRTVAFILQRLLTEGVDGVVKSDVSVLAVHIVSAGARVVLNPDAVVLDVSGVLLHDL